MHEVKLEDGKYYIEFLVNFVGENSQYYFLFYIKKKCKSIIELSRKMG